MSRLIVKGLPAKITEKKLRDTFENYGTITDVSLKYTKDGVFRKFAFIGFENENCGRAAASKLNNTYIQTSKVQVEECLPFSAENKPRPWSKYAKGSSAYKRLHGDSEPDAPKTAAKKPKIEVKAEDGKLESEKNFDKFLQQQGIPLLNDEAEVKTSEEDSKISAFIASFNGDKKLSLLYRSLPASLKQKNLKEWISPVRFTLVQFLRLVDETIAIITFNRPPDVRRALQQNEQYLGGCKVKVSKLLSETSAQNSNSGADGGEKAAADLLAAEQERQKVREAILDTGRLFLRNLPYICTDDHLMEVFRKFGEIAELQCIIDKQTGKCKGFAIVTFIFPDNALKAYDELDGTIFKGRMLHILPGESKPDPPDNPANSNFVNGGGKALSQFQLEREKKMKENAGQTHNWNPLFVGANATADSLAERLEVGKRELLAGTGDNSAAVRLAMAETQLVKETRDFLVKSNIKLGGDGNTESGRRSNTTIIVKNMPAGSDFEGKLRKTFARFGDVKNISFLPGVGLSAIVEMGNKVDAKRAFNLIAYSRLEGSDQPLYLEWARLVDPKTKTEIDGDDEVKEEVEEVEETEEEKKRTKLLVRNIPFQASLEEVTQLFSAFGEIREIRLPKKAGTRTSSAHRGFGFVDFASHSEAKRAMSSLVHSTHLYGRRLVVEWAKSDASVEEIREKSAITLSKKKGKKGTKKEIRDAVDEHHSTDEED